MLKDKFNFVHRSEPELVYTATREDGATYRVLWEDERVGVTYEDYQIERYLKESTWFVVTPKQDALGVKVKKLHADAKIPKLATLGSAGNDLHAYTNGKTIEIKPMDFVLVKTGLAFEIPQGYEMQVRARSGLALNYGLSLVNGIGTIDADYRGEVGVIIINLGKEPFYVNHGERIAQAVFAKYEVPKFMEVEDLSGTDRGTEGFGSTGVTE